MMEGYLQYFTEIIKAASTSPLGIVALIILIIGILAYFFFRHERVAIKLTVFFTMVGLSLVSFATSFYNTEVFVPKVEHLSDAGDTVGSETRDRPAQPVPSPPSGTSLAMTPSSRPAPHPALRSGSSVRSIESEVVRSPRSFNTTAPSSAERIARTHVAPAEETATATVRQNCGTAWSDWVDITKVVDNPCPETCKRGDELGKSIRMVGFPPRPQAKHKFECWK